MSTHEAANKAAGHKWISRMANESHTALASAITLVTVEERRSLARANKLLKEISNSWFLASTT
jgi:putative protein kinase ArgK-like GTPase of G3E family